MISAIAGCLKHFLESDDEMKIEERAAMHAALGDSLRLQIVDALRFSDLSPTDLRLRLAIDSNLMAHHLAVLERVGLIERVMSSGDRRRKYVRLTERGLSVAEPVESIRASTVLFVCTYNSARSQLAAAVWNRQSKVHAESAGTHPADRVHPLAVAAAARFGIDLSKARPRLLVEVAFRPDMIVTVCDRANEEISLVSKHDLHWSIPDPAEQGTPAAFDDTLDIIARRVRILASSVTGDGAGAALEV
jgi:protein-tyrosine-phosphatase